MSTTDTGVPTGSGLKNPLLAFGLNAIADWSTEMPFLDLMKESRPFIGHTTSNWNAMTNAQLEAGGYLDANGWPTSIPPGLTSVGTIWAWSDTDPAAIASREGVYVLTYDGTGTIKLSGDVKVLSTAPGQIVVQNLHGGEMEMAITSTDPSHTGDYIRNVALVPQQYEALHEQGEIFNPAFLASVQDARELRFMDWMDTNNVTSAHWADRPQMSNETWGANGVPLEAMVQLANQTGTEPWFNMPAGADAEYIQNFATYVRDHLNPALKVHVEYSNETWNFGFNQTDWFLSQAKSVWGTTDGAAYLDYAVMLATKSALIWDSVFGAQASTRLDNVLGAQMDDPGNTPRLMTAPDWKKYDPTGYVNPSTVFNSLAVTTYFGGATMSDTTLRNELLNEIKTNSAHAVHWLKLKMEDPNYSHSIPQIEAYWAQQKAVADQYGMNLVAYEGGQHLLQSFSLNISQQDLATLTTFLESFARSKAMAELYHELWTAWAKVSDGPFMQYYDTGEPDKYGVWGLFSALGDSNPRAHLLMNLNAHSASWFGDGGGTEYQQGAIHVGTDAAETLTGTDKDDFLIGGGGADTLVGGMGHDAISGGKGINTLVLEGTADSYTLVVEGSGYRLTGPGISDYLQGIEKFTFADGVTLTRPELLHQGPAAGETLAGTTGDDKIVGGTGDDTITGSLGHDTIIGGLGDDVLVLSGRHADYTLVADGTGYLLTGAGVSDFIQGIEHFTFSGGSTVALNDFLTPPTLNPTPLHVASLGAHVDAAADAHVQVDTTSTAGVTIRAINPLSALGVQLGLDPNSVLADYVVADNDAQAVFKGNTVAQNYWSLEENQAGSGQPGDLARNALTAALKLGSVIDSVHAITGTAGNDNFFGGPMSEAFNGAAGKDVMYGGAGSDILNGGTGDDRIIGGAGDDTMTGGAGHDRFYLSAGSGHDKIMDFTAADTLDLVGYGITSQDALTAMASQNAAGNLVLTFSDHDSVTLVGLHTSDLSWMAIAT